MLASRIRLRLFCELEYARALDIDAEDRRTRARDTSAKLSRVSGDESDARFADREGLVCYCEITSKPIKIINYF